MVIKAFDVINKLLKILTKKQKILFFVVFFCALLAAFAETIGVSIIIPLVNTLLQPDVLWSNSIIIKAAEILNITTDKQLIVVVIGAVVVVYILKNLYFIFYAWVKVKYACKIKREIAINMMESYINRGYSFFANHNYNEISQGINGDIDNTYAILIDGMTGLTQLSLVFFITIFMCITDLQLALGVIISASICLLVIFSIFRKRMLNAGITRRKYIILANKIFQEMVYGIKEIIVMRKQKYFIDEYKKRTIKAQKAQVTQAVGAEIPAYIIEVVCISGIMVILAVKMLTIDDKVGFVAVLASFAVGAFRILPAMGKLSILMNNIISAIPSVNALYENVVESRKGNIEYFDINVEDDKQYGSKKFENGIKIQNISFSYNEKIGAVLNDVNIYIHKGESVAIIGESGAGKSTLADIILGLLEPYSGGIYMDDVDIKSIPNYWSRLIGFVPQNIYIADITIRENVAFGINPNEIDDRRIVDALTKAKLIEFINELPQGIYTEIGDRGVRISGGQRQRIGVARALYHNPEILILDEATSALDNDTENAVMEAIEFLQGTITMIIIAHRLTTIRNCDKIYEISNGMAYEKNHSDVFGE